MTSKNLRHIILLMTAALFVASCNDKLTEPGNGNHTEEEENVVYDGDVLRVVVTLDNMGGVATRAESNSVAEKLKQFENYVDPEKFRVLVFNSKDEFLFESKSRWIKQLDPAIDHSVWSVAVPLYSYGNDDAEDLNWDWGEIRQQITSDKFKIAILANRPEVDLFPEMSDNAYPTKFDNSGPNWTRKNSAAAPADLEERDVKEVFDLHHSQYDPIYDFKGSLSNNSLSWPENVYAFIMGSEKEGHTLSATSSWVDFSNDDAHSLYVKISEPEKDISKDAGNRYLLRDQYEAGKGAGKNRDARGWDFRKTRLPDEDYPIPMYGIQEFEALTGWKKGTTIDLNRDSDKAISLLRSVVKLELIVPKLATATNGVEYPTDVVLFYSNIYARCEPMNVWTPTDRIWAGIDGNQHDAMCDIDRILGNAQQGRITIASDANDAKADENAAAVVSFNRYRERLAWYYGAWWQEGKWPQLNSYLSGYNQTTKFPQIFNPCIQRNNCVYVEKTYEDADGYHYVVYTGERHVNDPSTLHRMGNDGSGNPTAIYWCVIYDTEENENALGDGENAITYSFAIADYEGKFHNGTKASVYNTFREGRIVYTTSNSDTQFNIRPANSERCADGWSNNASSPTYGANGTGMGEYLRRVQGSNNFDSRGPDHNSRVNGTRYSPQDYPLPLVRNHVYTLRLTAGTPTRTAGIDDGTLPFSVQLEERHTRDISFK